MKTSCGVGQDSVFEFGFGRLQRVGEAGGVQNFEHRFASLPHKGDPDLVGPRVGKAANEGELRADVAVAMDHVRTGLDQFGTVLAGLVHPERVERRLLIGVHAFVSGRTGKTGPVPRLFTDDF
jgi:hypothetical protein